MNPVPCVDAQQTMETPRALVVISAGASRASSTMLYNALRILLRIRDPNTVAGWHKDLMHLFESYAQPMERNGTVGNMVGTRRVDAFRALGSVLIKVHSVRDWHVFLGGGDVEPVLEEVVDAVFVTHRDLRQSVRSIRDMGWAQLTTEAQLVDKDFCRKSRRHLERNAYLTPSDFERESTWVNVARAQIKCGQAMAQAAGSKLRMDLSAEEMQRARKDDTIGLLRRLGAHLDFEFSDEALALAARELAMLRPVRCDSGFDVEMSVNPVTHMHKAHAHRAVTSERDARGAAAIAADAQCAAWLRRHHYL
ncbi:unnamed protein product [Agarophyton chilense]